MTHAMRSFGIAVPIILAAVRFAAAQTATTLPSATTAPSQVISIASVEAFWSADLYAKTSGYVAEVRADIGDRVTKGQLLATLDVPELATELTAAQAMLVAKQEMAKASDAMVQQSQTALDVTKRQAEGAAAEAKLSETTLQRQEQLYAQKAATTQQIDDSRAKSEVSRAATAVAQAKIAAAEADLKAAQANSGVAKANAQVAAAEIQKVEALIVYTKISAPFDAVVTRRMINPGDLVQAATASRTTPMFTVQRIDMVRVMCDVPESSATAVRVGDSAEIKLFGPNGQTIHGAVTRIATAMNTATRTMRAEIDLENPQEKLRPGMYAQVIITPGQKPAATTQP